MTVKYEMVVVDGMYDSFARKRVRVVGQKDDYSDDGRE